MRNNNIIKVIVLGALMIMIAISYFTSKGSSSLFGIPIDKIEKVDTTQQNEK